MSSAHITTAVPTQTTCTADSLDKCIAALVLETDPPVPWDVETLADRLDWPDIWEVVEAVDRLCVAGIIGRIE